MLGPDRRTGVGRPRPSSMGLKWQLGGPCLGFVSLLLIAPIGAQEAQVPVPTIAARPDDVGTPDGVMKAFYEVISGPKGQPREWSRDRSLYIPGVHFVSMNETPDKQIRAAVLTHQEYVDRSDAGLVKNGFFEKEIHRTTKRFGNVAHVYSTYESRTTPTGPVIARGINFVQLFWDGHRWWIAAAMWDDERPSNPIPKEFLP